MLKLLKIKNIALIESMNIEFEEKLNIFTGETGAGKSIIIDSLNFLLGARADKSLIRKNTSFARVEGVFDVNLNNKKIVEILDNLGVEVENIIVVSRIMNIDGKNEIRINNNLVSLSMLRSLTTELVDIYGQNEQLNLLNNKYQLNLIDNFSKSIDEKLNIYRDLLKSVKEVDTKLVQFGDDDETRKREIDLLKYEVEEISNAKISVEEEQKLLDKKSKLQNLEKISNFINVIENNFDLTLNYLNEANNFLENASLYDNSLNPLVNRLDSSLIEINDIMETIKMYNRDLFFDENEFTSVINRLEEYNNLKRKYGKNVDEILKFLKDSQLRLNLLQNSDYEIEKLKKQKRLLNGKLFIASQDITKLRKESSKILSVEIVNNLKKLGMLNANIKFKFNSYDEDNMLCYNNGCDEVELLFSANLGEDVKPLKNIASGGELSRFMLALKTVIAETDDMPTMIFDEIDAGISGFMAQAVAEQIAKISKKHQVLVITHTAQIASMADANYLVTKIEDGIKTFTKIEKLNNDQKIKEISRFLSSTKNNEYAFENARMLIEQQDLFKKNL